jgi:hypothetical protein
MISFLTVVPDNTLQPFAAKTKGPFVKVEERYKSDEALLAHEHQHVLRWFYLFLFGIFISNLSLLIYSEYLPINNILKYFAFIKIDGFIYGLLEFEILIILYSYLLYSLLYTFIEKFRYKEELHCYMIQIQYEIINLNKDESRFNYLIDFYSDRLSKLYKIKTKTFDEIKDDLKSKCKHIEIIFNKGN